MADVQRPIPGGMPPSGAAPKPAGKGYMGAGTDVIRQNASIMNPADFAMMKQDGAFNPEMPLGELLTSFGFDLNAPGIPQLVEFGKKTTENADMAGKMKNIAGAGAGAEGAMPPPPAPTPAPQGGGGIEELLASRG